MHGTRARARAPEDHGPQPDETEPLAPISMVATEADNDSHHQAQDEPQHDQDHAAGVLGRATRSISGWMASRGTPGTRTPQADPGTSSGTPPATASGEGEAHHEELAELAAQLAKRDKTIERLMQQIEQQEEDDEQDHEQDSGRSLTRPLSAGRTSESRFGSHRMPPTPTIDDDDLIGMYLPGVKALDTEETRNFKISMKRDKIVSILPDVLDELGGRHPLIEEVLKLSEAQVRTTLDPKHRAYSAGLHAADRYVKRQLTKVLERSTPEGQVFFEDEAELRKTDRTAHQSGVLLAERVIGYGAIEDRGDAEAHLGMIKETEWFKQGDSETTIKLGISKLRTAWYELPPKFRDANDLIDLLLKAIPSTVPWDTERTYSQRLAHEMDEHEALGIGRKWSFAQLKKMITKRLRAPRPGSNGAPPAPSHTALVAHRPTTPTATPTATETAHMRPADGKVLNGKMGRWLGESKNFCFLKMDDGKDDVFCHKSAIEGDEPQEGEKVQFKIKHQLKQGKSRERAGEVKRAPPSATAMVATHTETDEDEHVGLAF